MVPGLLIPVHGVDGGARFYQYRPDDPRLNGEGKPVKYETPPSVRMAVDAHPLIRGRLGDPQCPLFITEGIRKADSAISHGLCCIALLGVWSWRGRNADGGKVALPDWEMIALEGRKVYIVFDSDVMAKTQVYKALTRFKAFLQLRKAHVSLIYLPAGPKGEKVGLDDFLAAGHSTDELLTLATDELRAPPADNEEDTSTPLGPQSREQSAAQRQREADEALRQGGGLLDDPHLLDRVDDVLQRCGLVGDKRNARLLYLALTSRLLSRPVNVNVEGPSAAGKNYTVLQVVSLFPADATHILTAFSERSLVYTEADLRHRFVIVNEAAGLHRDGVGGTIVRALAWDGRLIYETVDKTNKGLRPRRIEKLGPCGLITTTTKLLDAELATRMLTITVRDDPDQTRLIVQEAGRRAAKGAADVDVSSFVAAQRWLASGGVHEVAMPFGEVLGDLVYAGAVRMRRDFAQLLTLVQTCALLHQRQRPRDDHGRIVATLEDYGVVYALAVDVLNATAADDLTPAQREAVQAVIAHNGETGKEASFQDVARGLGIDKSSARRRLIRPRVNGFVVNEEARKGYPARLKPGDPLPEVRPAIPTPEALVEAVRGVSCNHPPSGIDCPTATAPPEGASEAAGDCGSQQGLAGSVGAGPANATPTATVEPHDGSELSVDRGSAAVDLGGVDHPTNTCPRPNTGPVANATVVSATRCLVCGGTSFWRSASGKITCATCHPPATPALVAEWIDALAGPDARGAP